MAQTVRNVAPFINDVFTITSKWWTERVNPVTGETEIHRGLDIATSGSKPVYSMLEGHIHSKGSNSTAGNWVIIEDNILGSQFYGYATRYLHLAAQVELPVGAWVRVNDYIGMEGSTGQATGIHLHVEMQDISRFNWQWHTSNTKSDYIDPTIFMGIDNIQGTSWIYNGSPAPTSVKPKTTFPWVLYANKLRNR